MLAANLRPDPQPDWEAAAQAHRWAPWRRHTVLASEEGFYLDPLSSCRTDAPPAAAGSPSFIHKLPPYIQMAAMTSTFAGVALRVAAVRVSKVRARACVRGAARRESARPPSVSLARLAF